MSELVAWQILTFLPARGSAPAAGSASLVAARVEDRLAAIVPVPSVERRRIARPRVLDHEGRHDVLPVPTVALRVGAVEVRLRRVCRLVGAVGEVAEVDRVLVIAVAALRRHRGNHGERGEQDSGGESDDVTA